MQLTDNEKLWADLNAATTRFLAESRKHEMTEARLSMEDLFREMAFGLKSLLYNAKLANPYVTRDIAVQVSRRADFAQRDADLEIDVIFGESARDKKTKTEEKEK